MSLEPQDVNVDLGGSIVGGLLMKETPKAYLIDFYGGQEEWIPKSQCRTIEGGEPITIVLEEWLGRKIEQRLGEAY